MSNGDIPIYGLDKELAEKNAGKYSSKREQEVKEWIETVLNRKVFKPNADTREFFETLKDGVVLLELLESTTNQKFKINKTTMPFKQMENINNYLTGLVKLGCPQAELFQTVDLYELKNTTQVLDSFFSFARNARKQNEKVPLLGPKLADKREVAFTEEQLNASKFIPSQQSGYTAALNAIKTGATPSGVVFGARRDHGGADPNKVN